MLNNESMVEEEAKTSDHNEALINEKIRLVNIKSVSGALLGTLLAGALAVFFCPFADPFFGILPLIVWTILISAFSFDAIYRFLFYCFGKEVMTEAKNRGKYLTNKLAKYYEWRSSSFPEHDIVNDPSFRSLSCNIHNENKH